MRKDKMIAFCKIFTHISAQIILIVGITVVLVISLIVMFFYNTTIKTIRENTIRSNKIILEQMNNGFEEYIKELQNFALNVRMDSSILSIIESGELDYMDQETMGNYLKAMFYSRHDIYNISVHMIRSDTCIGFSRAAKKVLVDREHNIEQETWFVQAASSPDYAYVAPFDTALQVSDNVSLPFVIIYRIIINAYTREPLAAVELVCDKRALESIYKDLGQDTSSMICLTDLSGAPYFISDEQLKDIAASPALYDGSPSIFLDSEEYLVVHDISQVQNWQLTKLISTNYFTEQNLRNKNLSLIVLVIATFISVCTIAVLVHLLTLSLQRLAKQMYLAGKGDLKTQLSETGSYETKMLAHRYNSMITKIDELIQKNYVMELNEKTAQIQALEAQINPHFLYNSLQVISSRTIQTGDRETYKIIEALAANLRYSFKESELVPIHLEIKYIKNYLLLLEARFDERLSADISVDQEAENLLIPKISVFTMIENSVIHALETSMNCLRIEVNVKLDDGHLTVMVSDNGPGISSEQLNTIRHELKEATTLVSNGEHVGLRNLNARLKLYFGNKASIQITSIPNVRTSTLMTISIDMEKGFDYVQRTDHRR